MLKRILAIATLVCAVPALASAWTLNTWVKSSGGTIQIGAGTPQVSTQGNVFKSYTTIQSVPVAVNAGSGYTIRNVTVNGATVASSGTSYSGTVSGPTAQSVFATFVAQNLAITATAGAGGSATPSSVTSVFANQTLFSPIKFYFTPAAGYNVASITGAPGTATISSALPAATGVQVVVTIPAGTVMTAGFALSGTFGTTASIPKVEGTKTILLPTGSVQLSAAASVNANGFYNWSTANNSQLSSRTVVNPLFTPATAGTYNIKLKVNNGTSSATQIVYATTSLADAAKTQCVNCHNQNGVGQNPNVFNAWSSSVHKDLSLMCYGCHVGANSGGHPGNVQATACNPCHNNGNTIPAGDPHAANGGTGCIGCHSVAQNAGPGYVQDNNGVRSITQEFTKWSHHVTGVALNNAHCAACHLEGKVQGGAIVTDPAYHMANATTHLRNADTDADMVWDPAAPNHSTMDDYCMSCHDGNGATSAMSLQIQAFINGNGIAAAGKTASPANPFGDTISNRYDKMQRPGVVNVYSQFNPANNSHHGVRGKRYTGRTRLADARQIASPSTFAANSSATLWGKRSTMYDGVDAVTGVSGGPREAFNQLYVPLENAGGEVNVPQSLNGRTGSLPLGDDSTLHCGDCHTVGQWMPGTALGFTPTDPATIIPGTSPAIGAHGSNNEYMLRNSKGTDERHTQDAYVKNSTTGNITLQNPNAAFLVCFNCHSYERYGSVFNATGSTGPHAGEYDASGRCNGVGNSIPFNGYTTGAATDGTQFEPRLGLFGLAASSSTPAFAPGFPLNYANAPGGAQAATYTGEQNADFGNIFGIQCLNCHNSGVGNGYGGIHGSANNSPGTANAGTLVPNPSITGGAYIDGMGNTQKVQRFLPGLGNVMHVPGTLGGITGGSTVGPITNSTFVYTFTSGGISSDTNWEQVHWLQGDNSAVNTATQQRAGAGCYTLPGIGTEAQIQTGPAYDIQGQSVTGEDGPTVPAYGTWGGCDDHGGEAGRASATSTGGRGAGHYGFLKRINRPITY